MDSKRMAVVMAATGFGFGWNCALGAGFAITKFDVSGASLLSTETVQRVVQPFAGPERSMEDITAAAAALRRAYDEAGYPVVQVFAPEQTAAGGVVSLRVIEGKLTTVRVEGNKAYDEANIRQSLPALREGSSPNAPQVIADIVLANENPAKQVAVNFAAGQKAGEIDATVKVTEDRVEKYTVTYDNAGSVAAGYNRFSLTYQNANLGNRDHMLTLGLNTTYEHPLDSGLNIVGAYRIPFYQYGVSLDLIGSYSDSRTQTTLPGGAGTLNFNGRGTYAGVRVNHALPSVGEYRHKVVYGLDYKDFSNEQNRASVSTVTSTPLSIGYVAQMATPAYQASGTVTYLSNLGWGLHGTIPHYDADTRGAPNQWDAWRASASLALPLPEDWQLRLNASAQWADNRLVNTERFGVGGAASVRGYSERAVTGDTGYAINVEAYTPDFGKLLGDNLTARGVFFVDQGMVRQVQTEQTGGLQAPVTLASIGAGLRLGLRKDLQVKADLAFSQTPRAKINGVDVPTMPQRAAYGLKPAGDGWGLHVAASYSF